MSEGLWVLLVAVAAAAALGSLRMLRDGGFRPRVAGGRLIGST